jgi:hypothetical protein
VRKTEATKIPDWWVLKCGCGVFITDYPFIARCKCGYIYFGSKEQLEKAKKEGYLMKTLKTGLGRPDILELEKELGVDIKVELIDSKCY